MVSCLSNILPIFFVILVQNWTRVEKRILQFKAVTQKRGPVRQDRHQRNREYLTQCISVKYLVNTFFMVQTLVEMEATVDFRMIRGIDNPVILEAIAFLVNMDQAEF